MSAGLPLCGDAFVPLAGALVCFSSAGPPLTELWLRAGKEIATLLTSTTLKHTKKVRTTAPDEERKREHMINRSSVNIPRPCPLVKISWAQIIAARRSKLQPSESLDMLEFTT
jgi:hypothetical protein